MASKKAAIHARQQAHQALAAHRQQRIAREKANEADLVGYLLLEQQIRDTEHAHRDALATLRSRQGDHVRGWHSRGEKLSDIAELTGKSVAELSRLIKTASEPSPPQA